MTETGGGTTGKRWAIPDSPVAAPLLEQWPLTPDAPPQLQASASATDRTVSFTAHAQDPDGVSAYWWSFGDLSGGPRAPRPRTPTAPPGTYRATVWASDAFGRTSSEVVEVVVPQ